MIKEVSQSVSCFGKGGLAAWEIYWLQAVLEGVWVATVESRLLVAEISAFTGCHLKTC